MTVPTPPPIYIDPTTTEQVVLNVAEWMRRGFTPLQAMTRAGIEAASHWSASLFESNMARIAARESLTPANRGLAQGALRLGYNYAGSLARQILWRLGLLGAGFPAIIIAVLAAATLLGIGGYIYVNSADKPISAGPAMKGPHAQYPAGPGVTYNQDPYYVFLLPRVSGGSILVGQESVLKTTPTCTLAGGGLCSGHGDPMVEYVIKSPPFTTYDQATAAWCAELKGKPLTHWAIAGDSKAAVYGGSYWIGTAPSCPADKL